MEQGNKNREQMRVLEMLDNIVTFVFVLFIGHIDVRAGTHCPYQDKSYLIQGTLRSIVFDTEEMAVYLRIFRSALANASDGFIDSLPYVKTTSFPNTRPFLHDGTKP